MSELITKLHYEEEGDTLITETSQDLSGLMSQVEAERESYKGKDMWKVATIPVGMIEKYLNETGVSYAEFMQDGEKHIMRLLSDNTRLQYCNI